MKKLLVILLTFILAIACVSCEFDPPKPTHITIEIRGRNTSVYWQMFKDGDPDTGEYQPYPLYGKIFHNIEPYSSYTLKFYRVVNTTIENEGNVLVEKRIISDTYETYLTIDHYINIVTVTYTENEGLGCKIEQSWELED